MFDKKKDFDLIAESHINLTTEFMTLELDRFSSLDINHILISVLSHNSIVHKHWREFGQHIAFKLYLGSTKMHFIPRRKKDSAAFLIEYFFIIY